MTFEKLQLNETSNCLAEAKEDYVSIFVRKIKSEEVCIEDFKSKWEKLRAIGASLDEQCGAKGISICKVEDENESKILEDFVEVFRISPRYRYTALFFKLLPDAGLVKSSPSKKLISHNDFYKSDEFALDKIEKIKIEKLADYVSS